MRGTQGKRVEFLEAREDTTEVFESAKETVDLVALLVNGMIVVPGMQDGWTSGGPPESFPAQAPTAGFVAFVNIIPGSHLTTSETVQHCGGFLGCKSRRKTLDRMNCASRLSDVNDF